MKIFAVLLIFAIQLTLFSQTPTNATHGATPEAVVAALYRVHDKHQSPFYHTKNRALLESWFVKPTADLIWKDWNNSGGEVGALDGDALYDAQDFKITKFQVGTPATTGNQARVPVTFTNFDEKRSFTFVLEPAGSSWKVKDIEYGEGHHLLGLLKGEG